METIKKYLHRLWFMLGFCPKEAKEIFLAASKVKCIACMCPAIICTKEFRVFLNLDYSCPCSEVSWYLGAYGFTRKNYLDYVKKHYPELLIYADRSTSKYWLGDPCIWSYSKSKIVSRSKQEFLKYLADKL